MQAQKQILQKSISLGAESVQLREGCPPAPFLTPGLPATTGAHSITEAFLTEIGHLVLTAEDQRMLREQGRVKGEYHDEDAHTYRYVVKTLGSGLAFAFRPETSTALTIEHTALDGGNELDALFSDRTIMGILRTVLDYQVSDVVISSDRPTRIRMGGQYQRLTDAVFTESQILAFFGDDLTPERHQVLNETGSLDLGLRLSMRITKNGGSASISSDIWKASQRHGGPSGTRYPVWRASDCHHSSWSSPNCPMVSF